MRQQRDQFAAHRNRFSARWTTHVRMAPDTTGTNAPGDGVSDREKEEGHWGSTAGDGSVPDDAGTPQPSRDKGTPGRRRPQTPSTPGTDVDADNESFADDTPLVGDPEGTQKMRGT